MGERLKARYYVARRLFVADMTRIFTNCRLYNSPDTDYYRYPPNLPSVTIRLSLSLD